MNPTFHCAFGQYISDFIQEKHTLGFPYIESGRVLRCFDEFCADNFPAEDTLSAEIGNAWAVIKPTEKSVSFQNRLEPVRELAKYMNRMGKTAYVISPELSPKTDSPYQPHIFTEGELKAFFHEADSYQEGRCPFRDYPGAPCPAGISRPQNSLEQCGDD